MIGRLMNRITFNSKTGVSDGAGGFVNTLADYYTCWAEIVTDSNTRTNIAGTDGFSADITFRIRYTTSKVFDKKLTITFQNKLYMINSIINENDRNKYFLIGCSTLK
jgi:SPP1 family predicted phage head-tail adaptor